jgi:hypothetical protein
MSQIEEARTRLDAIEERLEGELFLVHSISERNGRTLQLAITDRLRRAAKKGRVWRSKEFFTALKNASYDFDPHHARSRGGSDGLFLLDRSFRPKNEMMKKIFDRYLDRADSGVAEVAQALGASVEQLAGARLVSHHLRLLGVLWQNGSTDWLVLVDYDDTK